MKRITKALWELLARTAALISVFGSLFVQPATSYELEQRTLDEEQHRKAEKKSGEKKSGEKWIESRGYVDSFADDDEVKPDPREDELIIDAPLN